MDQAQVNLSRFNLFFPEKREFFQEGAGIFQFGTGSRFGSSADFLLFHSRRIGLSANREEIPIQGGLKLTGKAGRFDIGLMNMQTDHQGVQAGQNFTVARVKTNILGDRIAAECFDPEYRKRLWAERIVRWVSTPDSISTDIYRFSHFFPQRIRTI